MTAVTGSQPLPLNGSAIGSRDGQDVRPWRVSRAASTVQCVALTRLRMDELVNAWVADRYTPFQIALLGVFDATPFLLSDGALDVPRIRRELVVRARRVEALRRRVVWTRFGEGMPVWAPDPSFDPERHIEGADPSRREPTSRPGRPTGSSGPSRWTGRCGGPRSSTACRGSGSR